MDVPAHDTRDYEFAKKYNISIIPVLEGGNIEKEAFIEDGIHINSDFLNGLDKDDAIEVMLNYLEKNKLGKKKINYRLRKWIFARQRYWGEPVPIIHLENGKTIALKDSELPLVLPELEDYKGKGGKAPLDNATEWKNVVVDGIKGERETSTMPGSAGSSWYFLRYIDPHNDKALADRKLLEYWMPVDLYVGGPEHAVGHLLYSRFWNNYLYDKGISPVAEPFKRLCHQGMILGANGLKMGKRHPEYVVNPTDVVNSHGADALRLYEMFMGPLEADKPWSDEGLDGAKRFIDRVYRLIVESDKVKNEDNENLEITYNYTIKKVTEDYEKLSFNTAISQLMIFINECYKEEIVPLKYIRDFIKLIYPITPHLGEELWSTLGATNTITYEPWPTYDEKKLQVTKIELGVQVNGKLRAIIKASKDADNKTLEELALQEENIKTHIKDKQIIKIIVVPNRIVNIVVK